MINAQRIAFFSFGIEPSHRVRNATYDQYVEHLETVANFTMVNCYHEAEKYVINWLDARCDNHNAHVSDKLNGLGDF